jgi:hypothetical protein
MIALPGLAKGLHGYFLKGVDELVDLVPVSEELNREGLGLEDHLLVIRVDLDHVPP